MRPWTMWVPTVSISMYIPLPMLWFVDNVDHTMPSAPRLVDDGEAPDWNDPEMGKMRESQMERSGKLD